jgi:hypothetical protein
MFELVTEKPLVYSSEIKYKQARKRGENARMSKDKKALGYLPYACFQDFTEKYLVLNGSRFTLDMMPHMRRVYNSLENEDNVVLQTGRQVAKSTSLGNLLLFLSAKYKNHNSLFVTPAHMQTAAFSSDRLVPLIRWSPVFNSAMRDKLCKDRVMQQSFTNQSMIHLRSCYLSPDRIRGLSTDCLMIDECQDVLLDNIPVIEETLSFSGDQNKQFGKRRFYTGTPKTTTTALQHYWTQSTQHEWVVKCSCKSTHLMSAGNAVANNISGIDNILDDDVVKEDGFKCRNCGKELQRFNTIPYTDKSGRRTSIARWVNMNPGAAWTGYRISQLMVSWIGIDKILEKRDSYPTSKYYNEVLGLSYDSGSKPITKYELIQCCNDEPNRFDPLPQHKHMPIFIGVDWGTGTQGYTVITIATVVGGDKFKVLGIKKLVGKEADISRQVPIIGSFISKWNAVLTCCDWGFGADKNLQLREAFGLPRIMECQYVGRQKLMTKYDNTTYRYITDRTQMMDLIFHLFKKEEIELPKWNDVESLCQDILNIDQEYNDSTFTTKFTHVPNQPDDVFHSILYAYMAYSVAFKKNL